jgi:hypothetical protein
MKSDKEKAREILKERDNARKGIEPKRKGDAIERTEEREEKVAERGLAGALLVKRSG